MSRFLADLRARAAEQPGRIVFPEAEDGRVVAAAVELARDGLARPVLLGPRTAARQRLQALGALDDVETVDGPESAQAVGLAAAMVARGEADGCVAGAVLSTSAVLRAYFRELGPAPGVRSVSSAFYLALDDGAGSERVLTFADAGVIRQPDEGQLVDIARAAARARAAVVGDEPRVAFLSYSTHGSADGATVRRMRAAASRFRELEPGIVADGELQADAAIVPEVARRKAPDSPLAGTANVLVFPDLDSANIAYKLVERLAGGVALGPILQGLAGPASDLSRGASASDIVHVACITGLLR
jgi:phosphate acetyltransferase